MNSLPDTAEYWQKTLPRDKYPPTCKKGICDCQQPIRPRPQSKHCTICKRFIKAAEAGGE